MQEDFSLVGDFTPTQLDTSGISIVAPGLHGTGTWLAQRMPGESRAVTGENTELDRAIAEAQAEDRHTLLIEAPTPVVTASGGRGANDVADDEILLQVPLAADETAVVMYVDEAGIVSFHYPQAVTAGDALPTRAIGSAKQVKFRVPLRSGQTRTGAGDGRGWIAKAVSKVIKVIVVKLLADPVGGFVANRVRAWEKNYRGHQGLHAGGWAGLLGAVPQQVQDLSPYVGKRSLLLVHGTTSTTAGAFAGLAQQTALTDRLDALYGGRVLGFNHHTMGVPVAENLRQFCDALAAQPGDYEFDIVCHSRGGLVARALDQMDDATASQIFGAPWQRPAGVNAKIRRIVFVATPNAGTALAEPEKIPGFVDRLANVVNTLPDAALTIASGALISLVGAAAEVGLARLPGLGDQVPESPLQRLLQPAAGVDARYYAFSADYEPEGDLIGAIKDGVADRIFGMTRNDLVVPSAGVSRTPYFDLPADRHVAFGPDRHVHHSAFFKQPEMARIADWLAAP
jgi:hypothetical protein